MFVCCECCVLPGRGLCDGLITRPEESYRMWRVVVCDQEPSNTRRLKPATRLWKYNKMSCNARKTNTQIVLWHVSCLVELQTKSIRCPFSTWNIVHFTYKRSLKIPASIFVYLEKEYVLNTANFPYNNRNKGLSFTNTSSFSVRHKLNLRVIYHFSGPTTILDLQNFHWKLNTFIELTLCTLLYHCPAGHAHAFYLSSVRSTEIILPKFRTLLFHQQ
jgi:hypothetical protein